MKLHLGCGQRYFEDYVNIDFPSSSHTVQNSSVADCHADILTLCYASETVEEVRLHHVFEHFPRPIACALLASWQSWLIPGGMLHIEVPDFQRTGRVILNPFTSFKKKMVAERHLFGSHEASWAAHCEGYTPKLLRKMVEVFGFKEMKIRRSSWMGTYNIELFSERNAVKISKEDSINIAADFLKNYLLDDSMSEGKLLNLWMNIYKKQIEKTWAHSV